MLTGWRIVIEGREFDPTEFLSHSRIQPCHIGFNQVEEDGVQSQRRTIEFTDLHEGPYPLDMATEALDYITANQVEFKALASLPGIETKTLYFIDCIADENDGSSFGFSPDWICTLASLGFSMSIVVLPNGHPTINS